MTALVKGILVLIVFSLIVSLIALLPSTEQYPLPPEFNTSIVLIVGYAFAWVNVFWFLSAYWWMMLLNFGLELTIWLAKQVLRIIGWAVRMFS